MNITKFINSHNELSELPFLVVYSTILALQNMGLLKVGAVDGVEEI